MTLDEQDYLTYQLYTASKTPRIKKARIRSWVFTTLTFVILAFLFYKSDNTFLGIYFLIAAGLSSVIFPLYSRWRYKNHYLKYIKETYKNTFGVECSVSINDNNIITEDITGEARVNSTEIEEINEIENYYFIKLKSGVSLIIPKKKANDLVKIEHAIMSLIHNKGIKHNVDLNWKWR